MIIVSDISRGVLRTIRARFRLALRWNPRRSPAIELDRQGRIYRQFGRTRGSARFTRRLAGIGRCLPALKTHLAHVHAYVSSQVEEENGRERKMGSGNRKKDAAGEIKRERESSWGRKSRRMEEHLFVFFSLFFFLSFLLSGVSLFAFWFCRANVILFIILLYLLSLFFLPIGTGLRILPISAHFFLTSSSSLPLAISLCLVPSFS